MKKRKLSKDSLIYIGDETRDIDAAKDTGIEVIAVSWGYNSTESLQELNPDYFVNSQEELLAIFERKIVQATVTV